MQEIVSTISSKGQITLPSAVRKRLGLSKGDKVAFVIEGADVRLKPVPRTVSSLYGSVPPLRTNTADDFEKQIEEAVEDEAARIAAHLEHP